MSFGFGIGDVITVSLAVKEAIEICLNSSQHIKDTGDVLADAIVMLRKLDPLTEAYFTQHPKEYEFAERITACLTRLEDDIQETGDLVEKWDRGWVFDRVWLPLRYTSKIDEKRARIEIHNAHMGQFLNTLNSEQLLINQPAADAKKASELNAKLDHQKELINVMREEARTRDRMLREILKIHGKENVIQAACSDDPQRWKTVEADLTKVEPKMTANEAHIMLQPIKEEIQSTKMKMKGPVLCVDLRQGALSTMAQFHLEYLRLHAATGSQNYLTRRIEAAGYLLESDVTKPAIEAKAVPFALDKKQVGAQRALDRVEASYGKEANALELIQLVKRLRSDKEARGVKLRHFQDCDHILCFNEEAYMALVKLRQFARKLHPPNTRQPFKGWITLLPVAYSSNRAQAFADIKMAINSFVEKEMGWKPQATIGAPYARIYHQPYRARQFLIPSNKGEQRDGNKLAVHQAVPDIKRETGCVMVVAYWQSFRQGTLVTVVGPKNVLERAQEMVKAVCG